MRWMRLKIDLNSIMLRLKIKGYIPSAHDDWISQYGMDSYLPE